MNVPFEILSRIGLLCKNPSVLKELFYLYRNDRVSYVALCKVYPWRGFSSDHWYEDTFLIGGPTKMRILYKHFPNEEFLEAYWIECIEYDIVNSLSKKCNLYMLQKAISQGTIKVAKYCYKNLDEEEKSMLSPNILSVRISDPQILEWIIKILLKRFNYITIPDELLMYKMPSSCVDVLEKYENKFHNKYYVFYKYMHSKQYSKADEIANKLTRAIKKPIEIGNFHEAYRTQKIKMEYFITIKTPIKTQYKIKCVV